MGTGADKPTLVGGHAFGAYYYANCCGMPYHRTDEWLSFFGRIADRIVEGIAPTRVLDAGCALGFLVEALRQRHVDAWGVDVSTYAIEHVHESVRPYCRLGSVTDEIEGRFDLIVSIEVLEHMPAPDAEAAIANFCRHTDDVLFSSSPVDQREPTHVNVHPPEHWAELFARHDFVRDTDFDASFITAWAARFRRRTESIPRTIRGYERRYWHLLNGQRDARQYASELQVTVEQLQARVDQTEPGRIALAEAREALADVREAQAQAQDRIAHMEQSVFWKLRMQSVRLRHWLGGGSARP